ALLHAAPRPDAGRLAQEGAAARAGQGAEGGDELTDSSKPRTQRRVPCFRGPRRPGQLPESCEGSESMPPWRHGAAPPIRSITWADFADNSGDRGTSVGDPSHTVASGCTMRACGTWFRHWRSGHTGHRSTAQGAVMRTRFTGAGPRRASLAVLALVLGVWALAAAADDPAKPGKPGDKPAPGKPAEKLKEYSFSFDKQPWQKVVEWFADTSGLAFTGSVVPTGTFNFLPPKVDGGVKKYTIPEIIDNINEALEAQGSSQKYVLIRKGQT